MPGSTQNKAVGVYEFEAIFTCLVIESFLPFESGNCKEQYYFVAKQAMCFGCWAVFSVLLGRNSSLTVVLSAALLGFEHCRVGWKKRGM